jgi:hypothetical protein
MPEGSCDWLCEYFGKLGADKRCELSEYLDSFAPLYRQRKHEDLERLLAGITSPLERTEPSEPVSEVRTIISGSPFKVAATALIGVTRLSKNVAAKMMSRDHENTPSETEKLGTVCIRG